MKQPKIQAALHSESQSASLIGSGPSRRGRPPGTRTNEPRLSKSELSRMADIAKEKGVQIEAEFDGRIIRVMPQPIASITIDRVMIPEGGVRL